MERKLILSFLFLSLAFSATCIRFKADFNIEKIPEVFGSEEFYEENGFYIIRGFYSNSVIAIGRNESYFIFFDPVFENVTTYKFSDYNFTCLDEKLKNYGIPREFPLIYEELMIDLEGKIARIPQRYFDLVECFENITEIGFEKMILVDLNATLKSELSKLRDLRIAKSEDFEYIDNSCIEITKIPKRKEEKSERIGKSVVIVIKEREKEKTVNESLKEKIMRIRKERLLRKKILEGLKIGLPIILGIGVTLLILKKLGKL